MTEDPQIVYLAIQLPDGNAVGCEIVLHENPGWVQVIMRPRGTTPSEDIVMELGVIVRNAGEWEHALMRPVLEPPPITPTA